MDTSLLSSNNADLSFVSDHRSLGKLKALGNGTKEEKALALRKAAEQFEALLTQFWVDAMRQSNDDINPDSPLHSKYSSFFEDMLSSQGVSDAIAAKDKVSKGSITYLVAKQFSKSLGDEGKELLATLTGENEKDSRVSGIALNPSTDTLIYKMQPKKNDIFKMSKSNESKENIDNALEINSAKVSERLLNNNLNNEENINDTKDAEKVGFALLKDNNLGANIKVTDIVTNQDFTSPEDFVEKLMPFAIKAVSSEGMNPLVLIAQAALETGWGKHVPDNNNFYGIKAGSSWKGKVQELSSAEFEGDKFVDRVSAFRSYSNVLESMKDYVSLIKNNSRYKEAFKNSFNPDKYFDEIQKAGYATDPHYASKLKQIVRKIAFMAQN